MRKEKNKGITLIALIITIIVLLILAGVALATLTGDSGILSNAEKAKEQTNLANAREKIQLAVQGALINGLGIISEEKYLTDELDNLVKEYDIETIVDGWKVKVDEYEVTISKNGEIAEKTEISVIERYMLGETGEGVDFDSIIIEEDDGLVFINNETISDASESVKYIGLDYEMDYEIEKAALVIYVDYDEKMYSVYLDFDQFKTYKLKELQKNQIYAGNIELSTEYQLFTLDEENYDIDFFPWKKYLFCFTVNGESVVGTSKCNNYWISSCPGIRVSLVGDEENAYLEATSIWPDPDMEAGEILLPNTDFWNSNTVVLNSIYEIGKATDCVEENGFALVYTSDGWALCVTPEKENNVIPETVDGITVDSICLDSMISNIITIEKPLKLTTFTGDYAAVDEIKVKTTELEFLKDLVNMVNIGDYQKINIDLTECGNNITIPEELINMYASYAEENGLDNVGKIYVTENAKNLYQDYAFILTK